MNVLVTGAEGQLGRSIRKASADSADRYFFTDYEQLDITDGQAVADIVKANEIDLIINCAAYTDVERAESDYDSAEAINVIGPKNLSTVMAKTGGTLIHISTDYVFSGTANTPISEGALTSPTGVYGLTKLLGEQAVGLSGCRALILRTSWLYSEYGSNFVLTMLGLTASRDEVKVVIDQVGTPTYASDLAEAIIRIVSERAFEGREGIYHYSNLGVCSWFDFAKAIATLAGHTACAVKPCMSDEFASAVRRPAYSVLDKSKFERTFHIDVPYWADSLRRCINNIKEQ